MNRIGMNRPIIDAVRYAHRILHGQCGR